MSRTIELVRSAVQIITSGNSTNYRYTVTAQNAVNMPNEIFRMVQAPLDPIQQTTVDQFEGICTPADLTNLPINAPVPPGIRFRVSFIDLTFSSSEAGEAQWESIKTETGNLITSLNALDLLTNSETVTIGS